MSSETRTGRRPRANLQQTLSDGPVDRASIVGQCVCGFIPMRWYTLEEFCGLRTSGSAHSWDSPLRSHGHSGGKFPPKSLFFCLASQLWVFLLIFLYWFGPNHIHKNSLVWISMNRLMNNKKNPCLLVIGLALISIWPNRR